MVDGRCCERFVTLHHSDLGGLFDKIFERVLQYKVLEVWKGRFRGPNEGVIETPDSGSGPVGLLGRLFVG